MADAAENTLVPDVSQLTVMSLKNEVLGMSSLWQDQRIVLTFLRHFG